MSLIQRIEARSIPEPNTGCWLWLGPVDHKGYGRAEHTSTAGQRNVRAHRAIWAEVHGDIPGGLFVLHSCDMPCCVNPDHLFLGTHADNMRDAASKGRLAGMSQSKLWGATQLPSGRWQAQARINGRNVYLGAFDTAEQAAARAAIARAQP